MPDLSILLTSTVFLMTVIFLMWRPRGMNEAVPTSIGAVILLAAGIVPLADLVQIFDTVSGAAVTILSTIVMSIVLDSIGFFRWAAFNVIRQAKGSGNLLYCYVLLLCFLMTLFFNNDGSILITTPIIIQICALLNFKPHQKFPYLLSGALVATASSAPIGVSNLANLIALKIVGLDLNSYAKLMFVPSMLGIGFISLLLFIYFHKEIPKKITVFLTPASAPFPRHIPHAYYSPKTVDRWIHKRETAHTPDFHPLMGDRETEPEVDWGLFRICISVVILIRGGFFLGAVIGIPMELIALAGAIALIAIRWYKTGIGAADLLRKTPWSILFFALGIYVIVYALHNIGTTSLMVGALKNRFFTNDWSVVLSSGLLLTVMSNLFNNLPSVMIGTLSLTEMGLSQHTLQLAYLANIIGSDIGSLLTPMGTLASLIWIYLLRKNKIRVSWLQYCKVTLMIIPAALLFSLVCLYVWFNLISSV